MRLGSLIWIHSLYLEHQNSSRDLSFHLLALSARVLEYHLHRQGTVGILLGILVVDEKGFRLHHRTWAVVRTLGVTKSLGLRKLDETGNLLVSYLIQNQDPATAAETQKLRFSLVTETLQSAISGTKSIP
jgi:hypothetical protein